MSIETPQGSFQFPTATSTLVAATHAELDTAIQTLQEHKTAWLQVSAAQRVEIIATLLHDFALIAPRWVEAGLQAKGVSAGAPAAAEEWAAGGWVLAKQLRQLHQS